MLSFIAVVRHAESEGNVANRGPGDGIPSEFWPRHPCTWRLTDRGRDQARSLGELLVSSGLSSFDFYCVSAMVRAMETAATMALPEVQWRVDPALSERAWGPEQRGLDVGQRLRWLEVARRELSADPWGWAPPGGENLATVQARARALLAVLGAECPGGSALLVTHGEVISTLRAHIEGVRDAGIAPSPPPAGVLLYRRIDKVWEHAVLAEAGTAPQWTVVAPEKDGATLMAEVRQHARHVC